MSSPASDRRGVVGLLVLLFAITYLDRVVHLGGGAAHAGGARDRRHRLGLGHRHLHLRLLRVRDSDRHDGRPPRPAPRADAHRRVVVGVHHPDRHGDRLPPAAPHPVPVRRGRGRRVSERLDRGGAMVPAGAARHDVGREPDGQPDRRRHRAAAGACRSRCATAGGCRSSCSASPVWSGRRSGMRGSATRPRRSRDSRPRARRGRRDARGRPRASRGARPPGRRPSGRCSGWRSATSTSTTSSRRGSTRSWSAAADSARHGLVLSALPFVVAVVRQPRRRRGQRRARAAARHEARPSIHRRHGAGRRGGVHHRRHAHPASGAHRGVPGADLRRDHLPAVRRVRRVPGHRRAARRRDGRA